MRNFFLFGLALALVLVGATVFGYVPRGFTAPSATLGRVANLTSFNSADSNAVEVDGIRFEILMPERELTIPAKKPGAHTPVQLGIQITNKTQTPIRFPAFDPLFVVPLEIVESDGKALPKHGGRDILLKSDQLACPLAKPGQSFFFFLDAKLFWQNNKLLFGGADGLGGGWNFEDLKPGTYQARFTYISSRSVVPCYDPTVEEENIMPGIWTGKASTPFVMFSLV